MRTNSIHPGLALIAFIAGLSFGLILILIALSGFAANRESDMKKQAIERGYALHCPKDGVWAWTGECKSSP
ncbi:MAG: hypothetical protein LPL29_13315 [Alphaproteobacteria bacterium]|nr:hypothetical protein [Alphaproteobacteria bacterium]